jgi:hypothetical protein
MFVLLCVKIHNYFYMRGIEQVDGNMNFAHICHISYAIFAQFTVMHGVVKLSCMGHVRFTNIGPIWYW